jgi:hypothetical protein
VGTTAVATPVRHCHARGVQLYAIGYDEGMVVWERIRYARDRALEAEEVELQRLAEATTVELQQAARVEMVNAPGRQDGADVGGARDDAGGSLMETATSADDAERSYAGARTPGDDVQVQPGSQVAS